MTHQACGPGKGVNHRAAVRSGTEVLLLMPGSSWHQLHQTGVCRFHALGGEAVAADLDPLGSASRFIGACGRAR